jgi:N-acetylmuramoyl-L-alanine amidase
MLRQVSAVMLVGVAIATIFTAWTPSPQRWADWFSGFAPPTPAPIAQVEVSTAVPATATPVPSRLIGIVAGHKGNDSGAVCPDGLTEASVNLDLATRVQAGLEAAGFQVDLLNEFDTRLEGYDALAVLSIHNDSCDYINEQATGFKVAGAVHTGAPEKSARLVACLIDRYPRQTGLKFHANSITPDMTQSHTYYEVKPTTPVAIIEAGFLNLDRKILTEQPQRVAQGIIDGLLCFARNEPVPPTPTPGS